MMGEQPWQVLAECPHCQVAAALVQLMDPTHPASHLGRPVHERCRLCGWQTRAADEPFAPQQPHSSGRCPACQKVLSDAARSGRGTCGHCTYGPRLRETHPPMALNTEDLARRALQRWSIEEGEPDVSQFCEAHMGMQVNQVVRALNDRVPVDTSFDVIAFLFPGAGGGGAGGGARGHADVSTPSSMSKEQLDPTVETTMDPRTPARVLISVMVADGELRPGEQRFIQEFLAAEGLQPLQDSDLRIWRPHELVPPPPYELRHRLVEATVHLMHLDHERDGSEYKVVRAFAGAWGITDAELQAWDQAYDKRYATTMTRLWAALSKLIRVR
ncbi:MAG: putative tellurite resistance protein B-like protein [Kiritimatiellia bacterium]|jgi:uncharacterized tellurite resistance protein B-like protein